MYVIVSGLRNYDAFDSLIVLNMVSFLIWLKPQKPLMVYWDCYALQTQSIYVFARYVYILICIPLYKVVCLSTCNLHLLEQILSCFYVLSLQIRKYCVHSVIQKVFPPFWTVKKLLLHGFGLKLLKLVMFHLDSKHFNVISIVKEDSANSLSQVEKNRNDEI